MGNQPIEFRSPKRFFFKTLTVRVGVNIQFSQCKTDKVIELNVEEHKQNLLLHILLHISG